MCNLAIAAEIEEPEDVFECDECGGTKFYLLDGTLICIECGAEYDPDGR